MSALNSLSENTVPAPIHNNKNLSHMFIYIKKFSEEYAGIQIVVQEMQNNFINIPEEAWPTLGE